MDIKLDRVLVAGAGVSGAGCAKALVDLGVDVIIADNNLAAATQLADELAGRPTHAGTEEAR